MFGRQPQITCARILNYVKHVYAAWIAWALTWRGSHTTRALIQLNFLFLLNKTPVITVSQWVIVRVAQGYLLAGRAVHTSRMAAAPGRTNSDALVQVPVFCGTGISSRAVLVLLLRTPYQVFCLSYFNRWDWQPALVFRGIPSKEGETASIGTLNP